MGYAQVAETLIQQIQFDRRCFHSDDRPRFVRMHFAVLKLDDVDALEGLVQQIEHAAGALGESESVKNGVARRQFRRVDQSRPVD